MIINAALVSLLMLFLPIETLGRPHGPSRLDSRGMLLSRSIHKGVQTHHRPRHQRSSRRALPDRDIVHVDKRSLNNATSGNVLRLSLQKAPRVDGHPRLQFLLHQTHSLIRYLRATGNVVDYSELRKRGMPIGWKTRPLRHHAGHPHTPKKAIHAANEAVKASKNPAVSATAPAQATDAGFSELSAEAAAKDSITAPKAPTSAHSIGLAIEANDIGYFGIVSIGTPPRSYKILLDSGSADFWVPSTSCTMCGKHQRLGSATSSTFQPSRKEFTVTYGTGEVKGVVVQDTVSLAGMTLRGHLFGVSVAETQDFSTDTPFDGIMGLASSKLSEQGVPTPIESLKKAGLVDAAQMGFKLGRVGDGDNDGEATFGGVDASKFTGPLTLVDNISKQGFWEAALDDVSVNNRSLNLGAGRSAILDTGTTLIVAPSADAEAVHAAIPGAQSDGQGGFTLPCTNTATVALVIGGKSFAINPADMAFLPLDLDNLSGTCQSGITSGTIGSAGEWLVGDVAIKNFYFATDLDNNQIGLAPLS